MSERLFIIGTVDNPANVTAVQAVPIQGGWGPGRKVGVRRLWGVWPSTFIAGTRVQLVALRDAGTIRALAWDDATETNPQFEARWRASEGA